MVMHCITFVLLRSMFCRPRFSDVFCLSFIANSYLSLWWPFEVVIDICGVTSWSWDGARTLLAITVWDVLLVCRCQVYYRFKFHALTGKCSLFTMSTSLSPHHREFPQCYSFFFFCLKTVWLRVGRQVSTGANSCWVTIVTGTYNGALSLRKRNERTLSCICER